uniref:Uncharacterized protein n=1 Tax=viral metagenome TaxID=1070528 RepID=A0A6M3JPQ2_9ZZZZ
MVQDSGIDFTSNEESDIAPPLGGPEAAEPTPHIDEGKVSPKEVPLHPAMIRIPMRAEGLALEHITGWEGWPWTEEELNDFAEMGAALDIRLNPLWQFMVAIISAHAIKISFYVRWSRAGKPTQSKTSAEGE